MLDLLAVSYRNIGPFRDQKKSLFFKQGKYLIKAPIGSGKSFLFFDGPSYALYKTASRNLLNIQSKIGTIKLLFSYNDQVFLIKRTLKKGKSKDSCTSQLFEIEKSPFELESLREKSDILHDNLDIEDYLTEKCIPMQETQFKNESDLQAHLNDFLPPHEVFTSTVILLQDAENIFELQPAQRLEVLKNVFNLMGIEESKEVVKERRNELRYQIKAYEDTSLSQEKLKTGIHTLISLWKEIFASAYLSNQAEGAKNALEELESFVEKLGISQFELDEAIGEIIEPMKSVISRYQEENQQRKSQLSAFLTQKADMEKQILSLQTETRKSQMRIEEIDLLLQKNNPEVVAQLRNEKISLQEQQNHMEQSGFAIEIRDFWNQHQERLNLEPKTDFSLLQNWLSVQSLIALGKNLKSESELLSAQAENLKVKRQTEQNNLETQLKSLIEREVFYRQQMQDLEAKILAFDAATEQSAVYECEKIGEPCPFIKAINKQHFDQRETEKSRLLMEKTTLIDKIQSENLTQKIENTRLDLDKINSGKEQAEQMQVLTQKQKENEEKIQILRAFLMKIDFKALESLAHNFRLLTNKIADLDKELSRQELLAQQAQSLQQEKAVLQGGLSSFGVQIEQVESQKQALMLKIDALQAEIMKYQSDDRDRLSRLVQNYESTYQNLKNLILDHKNLQVKIKSLSEQTKILDNLYTILNKELLLFVLSEYLPILSEIVNTYLVSVVDYQISIRLTETSEKLELETKILDSKGERDIKSLSGGQRAILKLVWMLAISSYMKTKLLFLDETINNLDNETVAKVADMLNDFVKQREMKFYTITHNSEIQSMNIWDEIIEVKS